MAEIYDPKKIEAKWQSEWQKEGVYRTQNSPDKPKQYILDMFPYPSGAGLHVGHPRGYIGSDVLARMRRMQGFNVLHPMGFDAFGLPAEQYAIQTGKHPSIVTEKAIATYKKQLEIIGFSYDWDREVRTMDPGYYKWTQWIFLQLFDSYYDEKENKAKPIAELISKFEKEDSSWKEKSEKEKQDILMEYRLSFEGYSEVNWCPELGTVLANDEVEDGPNGTLVSERGGYPVEKKNMRQWFLRITAYADRLLSGLETIDWPEHIKEIQRNWIGKSAGAEIIFKIKKAEPVGEIPVMVDPKNPPVEGKPTVRRRNIHAVVYSPERDAYLTFIWKKLPWTTIVVGGVDEGENLVECARREVREETGYTDLQFEGILGSPIESHYFAAHKDENREAITTGVYFTLRSEAQVPVAEEERVHNDVVWTPAVEFLPEKLAHVEISAWLERIAQLKSAPSIKVFTTRPDTLFGVTYIAVSGEKDRFTGTYAINPANGEEIPIWEAEYVMSGYGTGAVMGVPAHDERDFEFAKKYNLPFKQVVAVDWKGKGKWVVKDGYEILQPNPRRTITIALENKKGEILVIFEPDTTTLIGGGIDGDESPEEAALREIKEETGYINVKLSPRILENYFATNFRISKQKNNTSNDYLFHAFLEDEAKIDSEAEHGKHVFKWIPKEKVAETIPVEHHHNHIWRLINNPVFAEAGLMVNSNEFNGLSSEEAKPKITAFVGGKMVTKYRMRDAVFARQRYWGEPIPLVYKDGLIKPLSEKDLPLELPKVDSYKPTGTGESPLAGVPEWVAAGYETNTMPGWAASSWYFLRYMDPKNNKAFVSTDAIDYWQNVDVYVGGSEHSTGHLLYSRFWHKFLHDLGHVSTEEPFKVLRNPGFIIASDGRKMSKRWGNVVNPDEMVERFGADAFRLYEMFVGPFDQYTMWNTDGLVGTRRFLERVWKLKEKVSSGESSSHVLVHKTIKKVSGDISNFKFNTCVSDMMILLNALEKEESISKSDFDRFLQILAPFAPHMTEELWRELGGEGSIHLSAWPKYDESKIKDEKITIVIQINGKVRDEIEIDPDMSEEELSSHVLVREKIIEKLAGQAPKKIIYVKGRLINIVI